MQDKLSPVFGTGAGIVMCLGVGVIGVEGVWFLEAMRWGGDLSGVIGVLATGSFGVEGVELGFGRSDLTGGRAGVMAWSFFNWLGEIEKTWLSAIARVASEVCMCAVFWGNE